MRTYGRNQVTGAWEVVETDSSGFNDFVYITALIQNLGLILGESPFFANDGIPAQDSVITQIFPDFYVSQIQSKFAPYFAALNVVKINSSSPKYEINLMTNKGVVQNQTVAV